MSSPMRGLRAAQLMVGGFSSTEGALMDACRMLGVEPSQDRIRAGAELRYAYTRDALSPRPGTVETISTLKDSGCRVGLISNCGEEVSRLWHSTPFAPLVDAAVLSFDAGLAKPDPRIYDLAVGRLGGREVSTLAPAAKGRDDIGDGIRRCELRLCASRAGMTAVLMRAPYDQADGGREGWKGETISDIRDVFGLCAV